MHLFNRDEVDRKREEHSRRRAAEIDVLRFSRRPHRSVVLEVPPGKEGSRSVEKDSVIGVFKQTRPQEPYYETC
jgi:hypothetical protein